MPSIQGKTVLVTGASSGIGKSTAEELLKTGAKVYVAARRIEKMDDLAAKGAVPVSMDITNEESIKTGIDSILNKESSIDILVNNAGYGSYGAIEEIPIAEAKRQFEVNVFGLARITQLVLPGMRKNRYGKIVNISSMAGKIYSPFGAWYHATKHALEGFSDCLRIETKKFGIDTIIIEPGGIKTDWGIIAADNLLKTSANGAYAEEARKSADKMRQRYSGNGLSEVSVISKTILKAVTADRPKTRYSAGYMAGSSIFLRKILSDSVFDKLVTSMM